MTAANLEFSIRKRFVILCEGPNDTAFFNALIKADVDLSDYQATDPIGLGHVAAGNQHWLPALKILMGATDIEKVDGLLIVGDKENDASGSFDKIVGALSAAPKFPGPPARKLAIPAKDRKRISGPPAISILMMPPAAKRGALESSLVVAANNASNAATKKCVDAFCACAQLNAGGPANRAKARLRALLLSQYKKDPSLSFSNIWRDCPKVVPLSDSVFDPIKQYLYDFKKGI